MQTLLLISHEIYLGNLVKDAFSEEKREQVIEVLRCLGCWVGGLAGQWRELSDKELGEYRWTKSCCQPLVHLNLQAVTSRFLSDWPCGQIKQQDQVPRFPRFLQVVINYTSSELRYQNLPMLACHSLWSGICQLELKVTKSFKPVETTTCSSWKPGLGYYLMRACTGVFTVYIQDVFFRTSLIILL